MTEDVAGALRALGVATVHEACGRRPVARGVRLLVGEPFAGRAVTVTLAAGDNLGVHLALGAAEPGAVVCVGSGGGGYGVLGELLLSSARARGVAGVVIDDGVRDFALLAAPPSVAARGISSHGTVKRRVRRGVGSATTIGGVLVRSGDWVLADADGVCVIPASDLERVLTRATARERDEAAVRKRLATGEPSTAVFGLDDRLPASL